MIRNYFKVAWRNLIKNKLHTTVNLGGLLIGFTVGLGILLVVYDQFHYDRFNENGKYLYQAYQEFNNPAGQSVQNDFSIAAAPIYKAENPVVEKVTRIADGGNRIEYNGRILTIPVTLVDADFLSMFTFPVASGNSQPLRSLSEVVLTESTAKQIFGRQDPIGQKLKLSIGGTLQTLTVSSVLKDVRSSSVRFDILARVENIQSYSADMTDWGSRSSHLFVQLKPGISAAQAENGLKLIDHKYVPGWYTDLEKKGARPDKNGNLFLTRLLPMNEVHFSSRVNGHRAVTYAMMFSVMLVGLFIIFIACFNFVNINLATAFTRSREIGVRKCLGAARGRLFAQLWIETLLLCCMAFVISLFLVNIFLHSINGLDEVRESLTAVLWQPGFLVIATGLLLLVSCIAGGYPSWLMSRFQVVESLKGKISLKRKSGLRSSLIVLQFVIACLLISCTVVVYQQFQFLLNADLGLDKSYVISVPLHEPANGHELISRLRNQVQRNPQIISVTGSNINIGSGSDHRTVKVGFGFTHKGRDLSAVFASVDYDYMKTLGIKMLEGREFDRSYGLDTSNGILISETFAKALNEKNPVGQTIGADSTFQGWHVVGVFPDFHLYSLAEKIEPLILELKPRGEINYCFIKTTAQNPVATLDMVKKEMAQLEPGQDFTGTYLDQNVANWYSGEKTMSLLFSVAAAIAIILSCSGLLAMVLVIIQQRVKEIGVRKVLGASVQNISVLISREFISLVFIAVLIAVPIGWFVMNQWLNNFPYKISIRPWMFAVVAVTAIIISVLTIGVSTIRAARQNPAKSLRTE